MANKKAKKKQSPSGSPARAAFRGGYRWDEWKEKQDLTPVEIPTGRTRPESIHDTLKRFIRQELPTHLENQQGEQPESFDEANDFEPEDEDLIPITEYELAAMEPETAVQAPDGTISPDESHNPLEEPEPLEAPQETTAPGSPEEPAATQGQ